MAKKKKKKNILGKLLVLCLVLFITAGGMFFVACAGENASVKEKVKTAINTAGGSENTAHEAKEAAKQVAREGKESIKKAINSASGSEETAHEVKEAAKQAARNSKESAKQAAKNGKEEVKELAKEFKAQKLESDKLNGLLSSTDDIDLTKTSGNTYTFNYDGMEFTAVYSTDHWKIIDSYRVTNTADMKIIAQALIDIHPIHGKDRVSYRTAEDMMDEWLIHNLAYASLEDDDELKSHAKDVDFDPDDQGRSVEGFYNDRVGNN